MKRKTLLTGALCAILGTVLTLPAFAQSEADAKARIAKLKSADFPTRPIEVNVVYPAGGGMDINARLVAKAVEKVSGASTVVNNRVGGAGLVGHTYLTTQASNDGYTVAVIANLIFADSMLRAKDRWSYTNLEPIAFLNTEGANLVVSTSGPFKDKSFKEIVEMAKQKPGTIRISILPGTAYEYIVDQVSAATGAKFLKVPFQGGAPGVTALLGGNVDVAIGYYGEIRSFLEAKQITGVAVSGAQRSPFLPNAPTVNESLGTTDIVWITTRWVAVPKGMAADRKAYLAAAFGAASRDAELQSEFRKLGTVDQAGVDTPEALNAHLMKLAKAEQEFYTKTGLLKP